MADNEWNGWLTKEEERKSGRTSIVGNTLY